MLPHVEKYRGQFKIADFNQDMFALEYHSSMANGACLGICVDWISQHSQGDMRNYVDEINTEERLLNILAVSKAQDLFGWNDNDSVRMLLKTFIRLNQGITKSIDVSAYGVCDSDRIIAEALVQYKGYLLIESGNQHFNSGHAVAMFNSDQGYEFFDPNYGSALFTDNEDLIMWFQAYSFANNISSFGEDHPNNYWIIRQFF